MRNSAFYARKVKRLLGPPRKPAPPEAIDRIRVLLMAILEENVPTRQAQASMEMLQREFVDFNELRVSPPKDIVEALGRDFSGARPKAETIAKALNLAFDRTNELSLDYLAKKPKKEVRHLLREELGLSPYAESVVTLYGFQGHAIPVDEHLLVGLKLDRCIHPDSDLADLQGFMERITPAKDDIACHQALREYVSRNIKRVGAEVARQDKIRQEIIRKAAEAHAQRQEKAKARAKAAAEAAKAAAKGAAKIAAKKGEKTPARSVQESAAKSAPKVGKTKPPAGRGQD